MSQAAALSYHEPNIIVILILASFLIILNIVGRALDSLLYCGLLGQIFIGVAWGLPGGKWLSLPFQQSVVQLGYLGLILLVYEGGLSTDFRAMKANFMLSTFLALTGVIAPIGMSFVLMSLSHATPLQSFAAGASLCSTSLGTTLTVLKISGLKQSRLGVVLTCAAMLDDVVGLVMAQIISNLGGSGSINPVIIIRPILVSFAFAVVVPLVCVFLIKPLACRMQHCHLKKVRFFPTTVQMTFLAHTLILFGFVVGSSYAGTSNLYAAYLAGACIGWYDNEVNRGAFVERTSATLANSNKGYFSPKKIGQMLALAPQAEAFSKSSKHPHSDFETPKLPPSAAIRCSGTDDLNDNVEEENTEDKQLNPNDTVTGSETSISTSNLRSGHVSGLHIWEAYYEVPLSTVLKPFFFASIGFSIPISEMFDGNIIWKGIVYAILMTLGKFICGAWLLRSICFKRFANDVESGGHIWGFPKARSLIPPSIMGYAMVARGEIGFLISALAESRGIFTPEQYYIVTWGIVLCTIVGPLMVGLLTSKVRKIRDSKELAASAEHDPMGIWA
ncbi:cation:proton antiporter [Lachancea thermotolerans CBS 6340]|uniref:KLTH0F04796p n=1 Tax=Lachancea thermotolerans (strain ATCC 56472 / CBS 6340 / NRRL Y-8284) TaxID=559295 RepID=C5DKH9_LACTC|nr:KLTH0F04796p [Lachancea thermotolerans CBS 6340]CAR23980.1 KLTH0F04796p [Lachancea thermotolerans CBS 6340]